MNPIPIENQIKGWLMVAAFILFTLFVVWPAHAHDTLFQGGPRYAENMMGLEAIMSIPPLMGIVLAGAAMLIIGIACLVAYFYEADKDDREPEDLEWPNCESPEAFSKIAKADEWLNPFAGNLDHNRSRSTSHCPENRQEPTSLDRHDNRPLGRPRT